MRQPSVNLPGEPQQGIKGVNDYNTKHTRELSPARDGSAGEGELALLSGGSKDFVEDAHLAGLQGSRVCPARVQKGVWTFSS